MRDAGQVISSDLELITTSAAEEIAALGGKDLLLTGGAGFLGFYLIQALVHWNGKREPGNRVRITVADNFLRGTPAWLERLGATGAVRLIAHDITRPLPADLPHFSYVIHAASIASPTYYRIHPIQTMDANVEGLRLLLMRTLASAESTTPCEGLLFFSSSEIYGDPPADQIPTTETYRGNVSCTGPRSCYDESKRYGETLCVNYARQYHLPTRIARPFNNYGPGLKITDRRVLPDFARDIFAGRDIVMLSDGSPKRTFCYVADAIVGYLKVLVRGRAGEPYNIGVESPEVSMRELAERVIALGRELTGYRGSLKFARSEDAEYLTDNPSRRCPDISKARAELGFAPRITLEDGLRRSLLWYRENQQSEDS